MSVEAGTIPRAHINGTRVLEFDLRAAQDLRKLLRDVPYQLLDNDQDSVSINVDERKYHAQERDEDKSGEEKARRLAGGGIVYLKDLHSNLVGNRDLIESLVARADQGLRQALEASLDTLRAVYELRAAGWDELKQRVEVSFVKKTSNTNTSLTSGIAMKRLNPHQRVGILNCGAGNVKFQFYEMDRSNVVRYLHDATPVQLSLSSLAVPPLYLPKVPLSPQAISGALHTQLGPLKEQFCMQVRAVITGPLRACWEKAADKKQFEEAVARVFEPLDVLPWNDQSYFVTQDEEGALENLATSNLVRDLEPECDLMISFGIGKGGCQWATPTTTIKHDAGMGEPNKFLGPNGLKNKVLTTFSTPAYLKHLLDFSGHFARPVIALKSGCLLWLEKDPYLLDVLIQSPARPPRNHGPSFQRNQSLLVLVNNSVIATRVLHFECLRHIMELPFMDMDMPRKQQEPLSVDLRSTRFTAAPPPQLDRTLRRWSEILEGGLSNEVVVNAFRKEHYERRMASGGFCVPNACPVRIERAVRRGVQVDKYEPFRVETAMDLRDSAGTRIGRAEWKGLASFVTMTIHFLPTFQPEFLRNCKFKFCSWVPIEVELTSVPCLELETRLMVQGEGIYTLEFVDSQGIYHWRMDNSSTIVKDWPPGVAGLATRFSYQAGVKLIVLRGVDWVPATVCGLVKTQHQVQLEEEDEVLEIDLNDFNHTWREVLVDDSGGYDVCMATYKAVVEQDNRMVEDAITGKKLRVEDQLLAIYIRTGNKKGEAEKEKRRAVQEVEDLDDVASAEVALELKDSEFPDINNVHGLVHILLRECRKQNRHIGCHRVPAFIIVAAPGSGKTWTMRQLVYLLARAPTPSGTIAQAPFVIFVQVLASLIRRHDPQCRECELDFVGFYIRHTVTKPSQKQFLLQAFRMRTIIIIVDGIDEASDLREMIVNLILRQLYDRGHTLVATSRPEGVQRPDGSLVNPELEKFAILDLAPLTKRQQKRTIKAQLIGNQFFANLDGYSEVRSKHDKKYSTFTSQWEAEKLASVDRTKQADGKLDPSVRQRGVNGELLQTRPIGAPVLSKRLRSESKLLDPLLEKLLKQQRERTKHREENRQALLKLPPHRRHPAQSQGVLALTRSSLWQLVVAATDELYSIAEQVHPKLEAAICKMCDEAKIECKLEFGSLKDPIRVFEKALDDYWDRYDDDVPATACVTDIIRCRFLCPNLEAVAAVSQLLTEHPPPWLVLVRAKNKFRELDSAHFRNILFNFRVLCCARCGSQVSACDCAIPYPTSHLFEIQVHHEEILELSDTLHDHVYYEFFRAKSEFIKSEDLDFMIDSQMQFFAEIRSSPILLSLLILILDSPECRLPSSVYQLYEMAIEASITHFVEQRPQLDDEAKKRLKKEVLRLVQRIAFRNHKAKKRAFEHLLPTDPDYGLWSEICAMGANGTAVLSFIKVISQMELYQFSHLSFQEYLFCREAIETRQPLNFHTMVKDEWNYNALRIGVSDPKLNSMLVPNNEPFVWRDIGGTNIDLCYQFLKVNTTVKEITLVGRNLVALPRINKQVEALSMWGEVVFESPLKSGFVDCKLQMLDLVGSIDSGLPNVVEALRGNPNLKYLHLTDDTFLEDASLPASLFASNPSLVVMTLPLDSLKDMLKFVRAFQRPRELTVLVTPSAVVPSKLLEAMMSHAVVQEIKTEPTLQMWGFADKVVSETQGHMNELLANHVEPLPLSADLICVAPASVVDEDTDLVRFVSLSFGVHNFAIICLTTTTTRIDLCGFGFAEKSLPQLMLYLRNFQTVKLAINDFSGLDCLLSLLMTYPAARKVKLHIVWYESAKHCGLFGYEANRLMKAATLWGMVVEDEPRPLPKPTPKLLNLLLMVPFLSVRVWISFAAHFVLNKYQYLVNNDVDGAFPVQQNLFGTRPFNFWSPITFGWIVWMPGLVDLDFDITSKIAILCSYVGLLLAVLLHNLVGKNEIVPPERRRLSTNMFTLFELWSYLVHLVIMCQLLLLLFHPYYSHDFDQQRTVFAVVMLDVAPLSSHVWLWGTVAGTAVAIGVVPVVVNEYWAIFLFLPEEFYLGCGIFEIPIMFHLLGHCFRTILTDPAGGYACVALCVLALFMLADSSVWMYFKRVYSGRNALDPGERYMKLDLILKFVVVFLFYVLADCPQIFLGIAAGIFLTEFFLVFKVKPCIQMRGNYFHMGCLAVLVLSALYSLMVSIGMAPPEPLVHILALGGGFALIFAVTVLLMARVKTSPSVHMLAVVGRADIEPLPKFGYRYNGNTFRDLIPFFFALGIEVVVTPLIANAIHGWSVDGVCFPLQLWSVLVILSAVVGFLVFERYRYPTYHHSSLIKSYEGWSRLEKAVYLSVFVYTWFISGVVLFVLNTCSGEVFAFSAWTMVLVSLATFGMSFFWLGKFVETCLGLPFISIL